MTLSELERSAYIAGDWQHAAIYADMPESYKRQIDAFSVALKRIEAELVGDGCKTITGRRSMAKALRSMRLAHGLF